MKVLVLFSFVALCFSTPISTGKHITVGADGTVALIAPQRREIYIYQSLVDPKKIDIVLKNQYGTSRKIQIDETDNIQNVDFNILDARFFNNIPRDQITQSAVLAQIFREYQGVVDEATYKILLNRIQNLIDNGILHRSLMEAIKFIDQMQMVNEMKQVEGTRIALKVIGQTLNNPEIRQVSEVTPMHQLLVSNQVGTIVPSHNQIIQLFKQQSLRGVPTPMELLQQQEINKAMTQQKTTPLEFIIQQEINKAITQQKTMPVELMQLQDINKPMTQQKTMPTEFILQQEINKAIAQQKTMQQIYQQQLEQYKMTPLNRYLISMGVQQGYTYPLQMYQHEVFSHQVAPQEMVYQQYPQKIQQQYINQKIMQHMYQQFKNQEVAPQEMVYQQGRVVPQMRVLQQYNVQPMPVVY